jgi:ADP-heptose:LPS heptosyltransferase
MEILHDYIGDPRKKTILAKLKQSILEDETAQNQAEKKVLTDEEKAEKDKRDEEIRKRIVCNYYKEFKGEEMTDEQYETYIAAFKKHTGYNIMLFIDGVDPKKYQENLDKKAAERKLL